MRRMPKVQLNGARTAEHAPARSQDIGYEEVVGVHLSFESGRGVSRERSINDGYRQRVRRWPSLSLFSTHVMTR